MVKREKSPRLIVNKLLRAIDRPASAPRPRETDRADPMSTNVHFEMAIGVTPLPGSVPHSARVCGPG